MAVVVREADRDDPAELDAVGRLTLDAYAASGYILDSDPYAPHLLDAASRATVAELLVADLDGELVGTVTFCPEGSPLAEVARAAEGEFRMLAVAASARRQGAARALVTACIDRSRAHGYRAVVLSSLRVQVDAHRLYEQLAFRRAPDRDWAPRPGVDLMGYRLPLSPPTPIRPRPRRVRAAAGPRTNRGQRRARKRSRSTTTRVTSPCPTTFASAVCSATTSKRTSRPSL